jgi:putative transcriptional regulator
MIDDEFEWDDAKARQNYLKHGVTFDTAREALQDPYVFEEADRREHYGEERYLGIGMFKDRLIAVAFTIRNDRIRIISARKAQPRDRRNTMGGKAKKKLEQDWRRFDAMTDEEAHAAALSDPDAQPVTPENEHRMKPTGGLPRIRILMRLSQKAFAAKFRIPLGTLRDWEQHRKFPDAAARAYLKVIARNPKMVAQALGTDISSDEAGRSAA